MAGPRERTPYSGTGVIRPDPAQLTLGGLEARSGAHPAVPDGHDGGAPESPASLREPPVCGEWSFDPDETPEARATAALLTATAPGPPVGAAGAAARSVPAALPSKGATVPSRPAAASSAPQPLATIAPPLPLPPAQSAPRNVTPPTPLPTLEELKSIHDAHPGDQQTALSLSAALARRGNIEGALGVLQNAIGAGADAAVLRCARAAILSGRLRYDDAERELERAKKIKPDDPEVLLQQGILACRRAKWRDAVEPLSRVVRDDATSGQAHFYLGEALSKLDRLGEALEAYHRAADLDPGNWRAFKGVGIVLDRMGRPSDAAVFYRRARDGQRGGP